MRVYYIDKSHPNATDEGNPFGTIDRPRRTFVEDDVETGDVARVLSLEERANLFALRLLYAISNNPNRRRKSSEARRAK